MTTFDQLNLMVGELFARENSTLKRTFTDIFADANNCDLSESIIQWVKDNDIMYDTSYVINGVYVRRLLKKLKKKDKASKAIAVDTTSERAEEVAQSLPRKKAKLTLAESMVPGKKLLIFDLNKVLVHRKPLCSNRFVVRPYVTEFLRHISTLFTLAVWTSGRRKNVRDILGLLFGASTVTSSSNAVRCEPTDPIPLLFEWFQTKCIEVPLEGKEKPLFVKELSKVWNEFPVFDESNTVCCTPTLRSY